MESQESIPHLWPEEGIFLDISYVEKRLPSTLGDNIDLGLLKMHTRSAGWEKQIVSMLTGRLAVRAQWPG